MPLSDRILQWLVNEIDKQASVQSIERLKGSTSSTLHHVSLLVEGRRKDVVVRQFDQKDWVTEEPDLARHEAESLRIAADVDIKTPKIISYAETDRECGVPVVLMTMLPGSVELKPDDQDHWVAGLAKGLMRIHKITADSFPWAYYSYHDVDTIEIPTWSTVPHIWERAIEIVRGPRPVTTPCLIHRDYHPTNVLWTDGVVSGVVDWVNACRGPAGIDVGHCRLNLALLYSVSTADAFLVAYQREADPSFDYDRYWDLLALIDFLDGTPTVYAGWEAFGMTGLTVEIIEKRLDSYIASLVPRL